MPKLYLVSQPKIVIRKTANIAGVIGAWVKITYDSLVYQDGLLFDAANNEIKVEDTGIYQVSVASRMTAAVNWLNGIFVNGVLHTYNYVPTFAAGVNFTGNVLTILTPLNSGDIVSGRFWVTAAASCAALGIHPQLAVMRVE